MKVRALIATADSALAQAVNAALSDMDFDITVTADQLVAERRIALAAVELIVLDCALPPLPAGGLALCGRVRQDPATAEIPIILITTGAQSSQRVAGLDAGADDCLSRPLDRGEFTARIRALLRRMRPRHTKGRLHAGGIDMDLDRWIVRIEDKPVDLTKMEFRLLQALLEAKGRALSRDALLRRISPHSAVHALVTRTVDVHIGRLRRKLGKFDKHIITVRNVGFRFDVVPEWLNVGQSGSSDPQNRDTFS